MRRFDEVGLSREIGIGDEDGSARRTRTWVCNFVKSYWSWATSESSEAHEIKERGLLGFGVRIKAVRRTSLLVDSYSSSTWNSFDITIAR